MLAVALDTGKETEERAMRGLQIGIEGDLRRFPSLSYRNCERNGTFQFAVHNSAGPLPFIGCSIVRQTSPVLPPARASLTEILENPGSTRIPPCRPRMEDIRAPLNSGARNFRERSSIQAPGRGLQGTGPP